MADAVLIGPSDLALALLGRHPAQSTDTVYHRAVTRIREAAQRHGKKAGMVVVDGQGAKEACREFDFVIMTNEVRALQAWYERELGVARDAS